jgi:hypothetical protein
MAQLDRRWQATTVEKYGGGDGFNPFGAHRVRLHRATSSPVNERPAMMLSACRYPPCGIRIELKRRPASPDSRFCGYRRKLANIDSAGAVARFAVYSEWSKFGAPETLRTRGLRLRRLALTPSPVQRLNWRCFTLIHALTIVQRGSFEAPPQLFEIKSSATSVPMDDRRLVSALYIDDMRASMSAKWASGAGSPIDMRYAFVRHLRNAENKRPSGSPATPRQLPHWRERFPIQPAAASGATWARSRLAAHHSIIGRRHRYGRMRVYGEDVG